MRESRRFYSFYLPAPWLQVFWLSLLAAVCWFVLPKVWRHLRALELVNDGNLTAEKLQQAIALEPDRAEYYNQLGKFYLFSLSDFDSTKAIKQLLIAVDLAPESADYQMDLATACESLRMQKLAVSYVERARQIDPRNPRLAWAAGNWRALANDIPGAFDAWKVALSEEPERIEYALDTAWKLASDTQLILDHMIPPTNAMDFAFLDYLSKKHVGDPGLVWKRIAARGEPFQPIKLREYFNMLLTPRSDAPVTRANLRIARDVWNHILRMPTEEDNPQPAASPEKSTNLIFNGGFERENYEMGFGWMLETPSSAIRSLLDPVVFQEGRRSVRVDFEGTENDNAFMVRQLVAVEPGHRYSLSAFIKAENISGGTGVRLTATDSNKLQAQGRELFQTHGWEEERVEFTVPKEDLLVTIGVSRMKSSSFSPNLKGSFWIDNVTMREIGGHP